MIGGRPEAVLLDRDGTINVKPRDGEYVTSPAQLELLPGAGEAIRALNCAHVPAVVVTNQRGIALDRMTEDDLAAVHAHLGKLLGYHDAWVDQIFYCPHEKGVCPCRKPGTGLLERARDYLGLTNLGRSVMVGDSLTDVIAGRAAGASAVLIGESRDVSIWGAKAANNLLEAVRQMLAG